MARREPSGERLDGELDAEAIGRVDAWLQGRLPELTGSPLPAVTRYPGGASNWTYRLQYPAHDLVLRRPPAGTKPKSAHDMARESQVLDRLAPHYPLVPEALAFCADPEVLGGEFYVMRRIEGIILRRDLPPGLLCSPESTRRLLPESDRRSGRAALRRSDRRRPRRARPRRRLRPPPGRRLDRPLPQGPHR